MKSISLIGMVSLVLLTNITIHAQIKNAKTATVKVFGNTPAAKAAIEGEGKSGKTARVEWDRETNMATITYDASKTNADEILKRIALAGFDNEKFLAPDDVYAQLPKADQYVRTLKPKVESQPMKVIPQEGQRSMPAADHSAHQAAAEMDAGKETQLTNLLNQYFALKDALVKTDASAAANKAALLQEAIKAVDMNKLSPTEHTVWMKVMNNLATDAAAITKGKDVTKQRVAFASLSTKLYELAKVSSFGNPIYYQHCPMFNDGKGANWLSKEKAVKNPFYGSQMITCGSTVETLNK
ncbi:MULTISPECIES: DUF3347 domain-containing protein [Sphingobacterium]|uniref:DUF3347 domain-containing protein n=1 Tax=Sphingobacterium TaxID=28453 RepID=UPI002580468D|nr:MULTISPECIES: DUF3347 domain-containing protein [Sphingobacterium]